MQSEAELKASLSSIPFESQLKANKSASLSSRTRKIKKGAALAKHQSSNQNDSTKRDKSAPTERNAKERVSHFQTVLESSKKKSRDPRFDDLSGKFKKDKFYQTYRFLNTLKVQENKTQSRNLNKKIKANKKKKFTEEDNVNMKSMLQNNKQDMARYGQIEKLNQIKKQIKSEQEQDGKKVKFVSKGISFF